MYRLFTFAPPRMHMPVPPPHYGDDPDAGENAGDVPPADVAVPAAGDATAPTASDESQQVEQKDTSPTAEPVVQHIVDAAAASDEIELVLIEGFAQHVNWNVGSAPQLVIDEPEPLGHNSGPSPARVLAAALASCLGASLLFCLRKSRIEVLGLRTTASTALTRNERGRLRVGTITVRLEPVVALIDQPRMARCIEVFEDFCIVTASVRPSVTVNVSVHPVAPAAA